MVCNKVYWENINPSMKTEKAQLIFHIWLKLVWRVCDLCLKVLPGEVASAAKTLKKIICFLEGHLVFNAARFVFN